ncbi:uncharacterized protein LOC105356046 [Oryzias latipes]|nr:uncharacterized protein LOC105356046 [Oryzias latipes]
MEDLKNFLSENKEGVKKMMDMLETGANKAATIIGDFSPIFSVVSPLVQLVLNDVESTEAVFMREQFEKVGNHIEKVSEDINRINKEIRKKAVDNKLFSVEETITHQFRKYMEFLKDNSEYRKNAFLEHYKNSGGEEQIEELYKIVEGNYFHGEPLLKVILSYEESSRRPVEEYCNQLRCLFCMGIIALLGHAALMKSDKQEKLVKKWSETMRVVQEKMNAVITECIVSFPRHAKTDCQRLVRDQKEDLTNKQRADALIEMLKKKYDWVGWSVRVYKSGSSFFSIKKNCECPTGTSRFQVTTTDKKLKIWVSYSTSLKPLNENLIQQFIQSQKKPTVENIAEYLFEKLPGDWMVHTVNSCKDLACSWSFTDECLYYEKRKNLHVWVHSF